MLDKNSKEYKEELAKIRSDEPYTRKDLEKDNARLKYKKSRSAYRNACK